MSVTIYEDNSIYPKPDRYEYHADIVCVDCALRFKFALKQHRLRYREYSIASYNDAYPVLEADPGEEEITLKKELANLPTAGLPEALKPLANAIPPIRNKEDLRNFLEQHADPSTHDSYYTLWEQDSQAETVRMEYQKRLEKFEKERFYPLERNRPSPPLFEDVRVSNNPPLDEYEDEPVEYSAVDETQTTLAYQSEQAKKSYRNNRAFELDELKRKRSQRYGNRTVHLGNVAHSSSEKKRRAIEDIIPNTPHKRKIGFCRVVHEDEDDAL